MSIPLIIVDDDKGRANGFIRRAKTRDFDVTWLRPEPGRYVRGDVVNGEVRLENIDKLIAEIENRKNGKRAIWLWDLELIFEGGDNSSQKISDKHYKQNNIEEPIRAALHKLLEKNHVIALISSSLATVLIKKDWINTNKKWGDRILEFTEDWDSLLISQRDEWVDRVLNKSFYAFGNGIMEIFLNEEFKPHFRYNGWNASVGNYIPHDFPEDADAQEKVWKVFAPVLCEVLGLPPQSHEWFEHLKPNFPEYFQGLKTLVGYYARCCNHQDGGYSPDIVVLPILLLRAAIQSGIWELNDLLGITLKLENKNDKRIALCSEYQPTNEMQAWLKVLADELFRLLVLDKLGNKSKFDIELNYESQFFRLSYEEPWEKLAKKAHSFEPDKKGNTYTAIRETALLMGACGEDLGRDTKCVINAFILNNRKTIIEFRVIT